nr:DHA2 family efflux MFS transporter permease subunit [Solimonas marina]
MIAFVCGLAAFMEVLDTSIANVALVHISGSLSASADEATWVLTSYLVSNAIILPMTGWLSDTIGRKRYYLLSMLLFTISSVLCGLSTSLPELIVFRVVQGLAGGALQPVSQAILADSFPPEKRGMALAVYGMAVIAGPAIGPTLGGWLTDNYSWHWIFLINAPVGFVLLAVASSLLRDSATQQAIQEKRRSQGFTVDYWGFALIAISMGALQIMLDKGQQDDWLSSNFIRSLLVITVVSLAALVWRELRHPHPIINLRLLANRNFAIANVLIFNVGVVLLGATLLLPQFMQTLLNYSALDAGIVLSPAAIATIIMMPIAGRLSDRIDARILCSFGFFSIAVAMFAMTHVSLDISQHGLMMLRMIQVVGLAFIFVPINAVAYAGLPPADTGSATAIINLTRNVGGGVGISLVTTHLARSTQTHQAHLVDHVSQLDPAYQSTMQSLMPTLGSEQSAQALIAREVTQQATLLGFIDDFYLLTILALFMASLVWFARRIKPGTKPPEGAH